MSNDCSLQLLEVSNCELPLTWLVHWRQKTLDTVAQETMQSLHTSGELSSTETNSKSTAITVTWKHNTAQ